MPHVIAVVGLPGSGKSHYVQRQAREPANCVAAFGWNVAGPAS